MTDEVPTNVEELQKMLLVTRGLLSVMQRSPGNIAVSPDLDSET